MEQAQAEMRQRLNAVVGGSPRSQQMLGEAADLHVAGFALPGVFSWIERESGLAYGQVILEPHDFPMWIHVSLGEPWRPFEDSRQAFKMDPKPAAPVVA